MTIDWENRREMRRKRGLMAGLRVARSSSRGTGCLNQTDKQTDRQTHREKQGAERERERQARVHNDFPFITVTEARMHACAIAC